MDDKGVTRMNEHARFFLRDAFMAKLDTVNKLEENDFERYQIVKDLETGQHYLHYTLEILRLSEGGYKDQYDYFLPLQSDDVLGIVLGEQPYSFPDHWKETYLRSGLDNRLMWFDPKENFESFADAEEEQSLIESLRRFKSEWEHAADKEALTKKLFDELGAQRKKPS